MKFNILIKLVIASSLLHWCEGNEVVANTTEESQSEVQFDRENLLKIEEGSIHVVKWTTTVDGVHSVNITSKDTKILSIIAGSETFTVDDDPAGYSGTFNVSADFIGRSIITVILLDHNQQVLGSGELEASVILTYQNVVNIFSTSLGLLVALVNINIGATINLDLVKSIVKRPVGPLIGLVCQYILMPLIAFTLSQTILGGYPVFQLGMFLAGCCPGGGLSNLWTHILGGTLDLSIVMTFISTIVAFIALPAWVLLLGPVLVSDASFVIPFKNIAILLASIIGPCFIGLLIQRYLPKLSGWLKTLLTPFSIFLLLYTVAFGSYAYRYIFAIMDTKIMVAAFLLPTIGYAFGILLGLMFKQPWRDIAAISIETGVQNNSIALFMLNVTLEAPDSALACVVPGAVFFFAPVALAAAGVVKIILYLVNRFKQDKADISMGEVEGGNKNYGTTPTVPASSNKGGIDNPAAELSDATQ